MPHMSHVTCASDNDQGESVTRDRVRPGVTQSRAVMSPHASSDIVILITYLHNGINTPHYLAATSLLHCIPDTLSEFSLLLITFLPRLQDRLLYHFMAGILLKEAEPGFISDFFWGENPSFFNYCGHFL